MKAVPNKSPERFMSKNIVLLPKNEAKHTRQGHHQKANTQNINIYNIIHNDGLSAYARDVQPPCIYITSHFDKPNDKVFEKTFAKPFEKTCDNPLRVSKAKVKTKHELMLDKELRTFKEEVELKFNNSIVNQTYAYPRTVGPQNEKSHERLVENTKTSKTTR